jgi:hypothetical protein
MVTLFVMATTAGW